MRTTLHALCRKTPMELLADGVPLTLLLDLLDERGPASEQILAHERVLDYDWVDPLPRVRDGAADTA